MRRSAVLLIASVATALVVLALVGIPGISGGSAASVASAATPAQQIGMKVLLITDTTSEPSYTDWQNTLNREGVPFDTVVTSTSAVLPTLSSTLSDGTQVANYEGVIVATSGLEGLSTAQWTTLQSFEQLFSVRQLTAYAYPSVDYGLNTPSGGVSLPGTTPLALTSAGQTVFPYLNAVSLDTTGTFGYESTPLAGANVSTLVSGPNSSSLVGIYTTSDGRQTMYQTFDENQYMLQSELLRHGELAWLARSTYFGDQRNYLETNVDDNFLSDDSWDTTTHSTDFTPANALREVPADVTTAAAWSKANNLRIDMLFNGGGSVQAANGTTDPLLTQFQTNDPSTSKPYTDDFGWINHTWDHPNLDEGCATQDYIEAEINQNTVWGSKAAAGGNPSTGGLGLSSSTTQALGSENPSVVVTGEHAGLANLIPGNPGQVDPPSLDTASPLTTGGSLPAGDYVYAVSDQFNTAAPGAPTVAGVGESAASVSAPVTVTGTTGSVTLTWGSVCHAADYKVYRASYTPPVPPATTGTIGAYTLITPTPIAANTTTDFTNPTGNSTTNTAGGGAAPQTFTDTGTEATAAGTPLTVGTADESAYEQNPALNAAFAGAGITYFGSDASKPYPSPPDSSFATGTTPSGTFAAGATFQDAGASAIPRYPTNIYYNVSTDAQEVDEYNYLYLPPPNGVCTNTSTTTCLTTAATLPNILASVDQGMFQHVMGNDPRPHYFHQTNLMSQTTGSVTGKGTGLFYETLNPLLAQYHQYFATNAPIVQLTTAQIGTLLSEQTGWAAANTSRVSGSINGNVVTVTNSGAAIELPLTGTTLGTPYAGSSSYWTQAPSGTSTYTALAAWPAPPAVPVVVTPPTGPKPTTGPGTLPGPPKRPATPPGTTTKKPAPPVVKLLAVEVAPKTVHIKRGNKVTVSLKCQAPKGKVCSGTFTLKVSGRTVKHSFRNIKAGKIDRIVVQLSKKIRVPKSVRVFTRKHGKLHATMRVGKLNGALVISTKQASGRMLTSRGTLTIEN